MKSPDLMVCASPNDYDTPFCLKCVVETFLKLISRLSLCMPAFLFSNTVQCTVLKKNEERHENELVARHFIQWNSKLSNLNKCGA